jgi:hypothetical protein
MYKYVELNFSHKDTADGKKRIVRRTSEKIKKINNQVFIKYVLFP